MEVKVIEQYKGSLSFQSHSWGSVALFISICYLCKYRSSFEMENLYNERPEILQWCCKMCLTYYILEKYI